MNRNTLLLPILAIASVAAANLNVVTTTEDLASIAKAVGGGSVSVSSIVTGARDPHTIEAKPGYMSRLMKADLFIAVGLDLEIAWEDAIVRGSRNERLRPGGKGHLYASSGLVPLEKPSGKVTRAQGDIHPNGNPHVWLDPANARIIAASIAERMSVLDPGNKSTYQKNADAFKMKIDTAMFGSALVAEFGSAKLWAWSSDGTLARNVSASRLGGWSGQLEKFRGQDIVTYHRSWSYLAHRFGFNIVEELEPKPGIPPSAGHIAQVIATTNKNNVRAIIQEPYYSKKAAETVAARTKAKVVVIPLSVGNEPSAKDYFSLLDTIVGRIATAMGG